MADAETLALLRELRDLALETRDCVRRVLDEKSGFSETRLFPVDKTAGFSEPRCFRRERNAGFSESRIPVLSPADAALLSALRPAIGGLIGSELFAAGELLEIAATPEGIGVRAVLGELDRWTPKRLGKLLGRGASAIPDGDGYSIERCGALWRVVQGGPP